MPAIARNFIKLNTSVLLAALITFLLFYFMQYLIETESDTPQSINVIRVLDSTVPIFDPILIIKETMPEPIVRENVLILSEPNRKPKYSGGPGISIFQEKLSIDTAPQSVLPMSNNILTPLIRTTPNYPRLALQQGLEGFVEVSFTVDRFGSVINPVIINALPKGIFDRAALQAISRWKYSPAMNNGQAVETYDVRHRIVFQMDPSSR